MVDGGTVVFLKRRLVPAPEEFVLIQEHSVVQGDRLDNLAAQYLGDPEQFWRICDANNAMDPAALLVPVGRRLRVPLPYPQEVGISLPWAADADLADTDPPEERPR